MCKALAKTKTLIIPCISVSLKTTLPSHSPAVISMAGS
jgi:hypothetical protein